MSGPQTGTAPPDSQIGSARPIRFLCVCAGGHVRSHAMAFALKERGLVHQRRVEAITAGVERFTRESLGELAAWADFVVVMQPQFASAFAPDVEDKIRCVDVGEDRYGNWNHPELLGFVDGVARDWIARDFQI